MIGTVVFRIEERVVGRRRREVEVHVPHVHEREEGALLLRLHPRVRLVVDALVADVGVGLAHHVDVVHPLVARVAVELARDGTAVDVALEALVQPERRVQVRPREEPRGAVARGAEALGERRELRRERRRLHVRAAVHGVGQRREHRRVRGQRPRRARHVGLEQDALARQRVDARRRLALVPVARQVVGPERVDRDQEHVRPDVPGRVGAAAGRGQRERGQGPAEGAVHRARS